MIENTALLLGTGHIQYASVQYAFWIDKISCFFN